MTPTLADRLEALADALEAGVTPAEALAVLERVGGETGVWARRLAAPVRGGVSFAGALGQARALRPAELSLLRAVERQGVLAPALRRVAAARRAEAARRRAILGGAIGPFVALVVTVLVLPLPEAMLGGGYLAGVLPGLVWLGGVPALAFFGLPALLRHPRLGPPALAILVRTPGIGRLARAHVEAEIAAVQATLVVAGMTPVAAHREAAAIVGGRAPAGSAANRAVVGSAAPPAAPGGRPGDVAGLPADSTESLRLALTTGAHLGDLPRRLTAWSHEAADRVTGRLRFGVRLMLFGLLVAVSLWGLGSVLTTPSDLSAPADQLLRELDPAQIRDLEELERLLRDVR